MSTICGHDRDALIWALGEWAGDSVYTRTGPDPLSGILTDNESTAIQALNDPAKLAEMGVHELRRCGIDEYEHDPVRVADVCADDSERMARRVRLFIGSSESYFSFEPSVFRAKLLQWLDCSDGDSVRALQILRGDS